MSCGHPWRGAWIHCQEEGLATCPWAWDQPSWGGIHSRASGGLLIPGPGALCLTVAGWLAPLLQPQQCHQALCGVWQEGTEHILGSCPSHRRLSLQAGEPQSGCRLPAVSSGGWQATGGVLAAPALTLAPLSLCQPGLPGPSFQHCSLSQIFGVRRA